MKMQLVLLCAFFTSVVAQPISVTHTGKLCSEGDCPDDSTVGAEISGVTDFSKLSETDVSVIRKALVDYKVIYFKGIAHLMTPETQLAFAERFGEVRPEVSKVPDYVEKGVHQSKHSVRHDKRTGMDVGTSVNTMVEANKPGKKQWKGKEMPGRVARLVRESGDPFAFGEGYHADVTFFQSPPYFTFLLARELPGGKDDTFFIDTVRAYDTLSPELKDEIIGLQAWHNDSAGKVAMHPIVRTHPESGQHALYANSHFVHKVVGYAEKESKALLDKLFDHVEQQKIFKFKWTCDIEKSSTTNPACLHALLWDNRQLQHTATTPWAQDPVLNKRRRELHRVTISGDQPPFYRSRRAQFADHKSEL